MSDRHQSLAALIGTRICHDLISPIGAIGNGLELMSLSGDTTAGPEMALISDSLNNAQARIRFYRIAFGVASHDQSVAPSDARGILDDVYRGSRIQAHWTVAVPMPRPEVKLAFLLLQCVETALPQGGRITATHDGRGWSISGTAARFRDLGPTWDLLLRPDPAQIVTADAIQFALASVQATDLGRTVRHAQTASEITLVV